MQMQMKKASSPTQETSIITPTSSSSHHHHRLCIPHMLSLLKPRLRLLCSRLPWPRPRSRRRSLSCRRHPKPNIIIRPSLPTTNSLNSPSPDPSLRLRPPVKDRPIRIATFNAAFFSMAPAVGRPERPTSFDVDDHRHQESIKAANFRAKSSNDRPRSILKHSPLHLTSVNGGENDGGGGMATKREKFARSKLRVSINLPGNEISLLRNRQLGSVDHERHATVGRKSKGKAPMRYRASFCGTGIEGVSNGYLLHHRVGAAGGGEGGGRTMAEVLREVDADIVALQDVKAEEEREMRPLSDLAKALGMNYVFAESWAPEYGNAVLSRWPIRRWKVHKIFDDTDYR